MKKLTGTSLMSHFSSAMQFLCREVSPPVKAAMRIYCGREKSPCRYKRKTRCVMPNSSICDVTMTGLKHSVLLILLYVGIAAQAQEPIHIWGNGYSTRDVTLTPYPADNGDGTAVIICPGGSYCWLDRSDEGEQVAMWLQSQGISAFVLHYRVAGWWAWFSHYRLIVRGRQYPDAFNDLRQALYYVGSNAAVFHVDTSRIGLMGFSAGGHLVMSVALADTMPTQKVAFVASIYPVVTMMSPYVHKRSRRGLLGEYRCLSRSCCREQSLERHVTAHCPPVFLMNCVDDNTVDYHNSVLLDSALTAKGVSHCYIQYATGGHGFGASSWRGTAESRAWKEECIGWIRNICRK